MALRTELSDICVLSNTSTSTSLKSHIIVTFCGMAHLLYSKIETCFEIIHFLLVSVRGYPTLHISLGAKFAPHGAKFIIYEIQIDGHHLWEKS